MMIIGLSHYGVVAYIYIFIYVQSLSPYDGFLSYTVQYSILTVFRVNGCHLFFLQFANNFIKQKCFNLFCSLPCQLIKKKKNIFFIVNGCHICGTPQTHCSCSSLPTILLSKSVFIFFCSLTCQLIDRSKKNIFPSEWVPSVGETSGHCSSFSLPIILLSKSVLIFFLVYHVSQGWEFAHLISERNARFLSKNEQMSDLLIRSFFVSEMSNLLTSLISSKRPERIAHGHSFPLSNLSDSLTVAHLS